MNGDLIRRAAETLRERAAKATPGPWRDSTVGGVNRYGALVADAPHPDRTNPDTGGWAWDDGYGGCLIGESLMAADRAYIATVHPGVALAIAAWLDDVCDCRQDDCTESGLDAAEHIARVILGEPL